MQFSRDDIDEVHLEPSMLGGFVVRLVDFDGRTIYFQRFRTMEEAVVCLKMFGITPPPRVLAA